ncbi:MAG: hypothetical protein C0412_16345 [Flavobacterium sp.]|nr:hypothetical protein [Flavobacterium sp.]
MKKGQFCKLFLGIIIFLNSGTLLFSQENIELGSMNTLRNLSGSFYDFSEQGKMNIRVAVWGYVRNPGKYIIPMNSNAADLLSYAGGLLSDAYFDDLRIYRMKPDSTYILVKFSFEDIFWKNNLSKENSLKIPNLQGGDIIAVPGQPKMYFRDWFTLTLSVVSTLISLSILLFK